MVKTTLYDMLKRYYIHDVGITEDYFNTHKNDIEKSATWLMLVINIAVDPYYPWSLRYAAERYAHKLVRKDRKANENKKKGC